MTKNKESNRYVVALEMRIGQHLLIRVDNLLSNHGGVVLRVELDSDRLLFWNWLKTEITSRHPDVVIRTVNVSGLRARRQAAELVTTPEWNGSEVDLPTLDISSPGFDDLLRILYSRREEQMLHHGMFIPRSTQRHALRLCMQHERHEILIEAFDLIDEAALVSQQSILALATSVAAARQLESRMQDMANVIRGVLSQRLRFAVGAPPTFRALLRAVREFEQYVRVLGGSNRAAALSLSVVGRIFHNRSRT